jgi:hypothetical protein
MAVAVALARMCLNSAAALFVSGAMSDTASSSNIGPVQGLAVLQGRPVAWWRLGRHLSTAAP